MDVMLKTIEEWNDHFDNQLGHHARVRYSFNKSIKTLKHYVFINPSSVVDWSNQYIQWMYENYPDIKHGPEYVGYYSGGEVIFMFNNKEIAMAFKLRWS